MTKRPLKSTLLVMKVVTLKALKEHLSALTKEVANGEPIEVLKYQKPYIRLVKSNEQGICRGLRFGKAQLTSSFKLKGNRSLKALAEDRAD